MSMNALHDLTKWKGINLTSSDSNFGLLQSTSEAMFTYEVADDWRDWESIALEVILPEGSKHPFEISVQVYPLEIGRPEYIEKTTAKVTVAGQGLHKIEIGFAQFDHMQLTGAFWRFIHKLSISVRRLDELSSDEGSLNKSSTDEIQLGDVRLQQKGIMDFSAPMLSKVGEPGETVSYDLQVANQTKDTQAVSLGIECYGFESIEATLEPQQFVLNPGETRSIRLDALIHDRIAPGGYETLTVYAVPNGDVNYRKQLTLYTVRKLPHPYIMHNEAGWDEVRRNAASQRWAADELARYVKIAEKWVVPKTKGAGAPYSFELQERLNFYAAAVSYKLTGRREFLEKAATFMRRLSDPETGFPSTRAPIFHIRSAEEPFPEYSPVDVKLCGGGLIHEGEFLLHITSGYDLLYDEDIWTEEDHAQIEATFRLFIDKAHWAITDGDLNNIPFGGMVGALLCSLVIQDMHWMQRFIHGPGGFMDMVATGIMDDGWYFEGASNYVIIFADLCTRVIQACLPWGINLRDAYMTPSYNKNAMLAPWSLPGEKPFLGMSFEKFGPVKRNFRSVKDTWDATLPFIDDRGVLFANNDSTDKDMAKLYDFAYYVWRDPRYVPVIQNEGSVRRDLVYGVAELPDSDTSTYGQSTYADNIGLGLLRSQTDGRTEAEQIQAVVKYGSHGGYHGHYDRTGLVSLARHGRSTHGPMASWFGYGSYMFKMWVQTSMAHNMVVVDQRMQEPVESKRLLFHSGKMMQVCAVETNARWSDPPYGGQTPYPESFPEEIMWKEGRELPIPPVPRAQGDIGEYSEPIMQRRMMIVTDNYVVVVDMLRGTEAHTYDCLYHFQGYEGMSAKSKQLIRQTGQMNTDPYGAGQFITDCEWYACEGPTVVKFSHDYDQQRDDSAGRHVQLNENGRMNTDLHIVWPREQEVMTGWFPEADTVNKRLSYRILGDRKTLAQGRLGAWIIGKKDIDVTISGLKELVLEVKVDAAQKKTVFWGDPHVLTAAGEKILLSSLPIRYENVDEGNGIGHDYDGGPVHLAGVKFDHAIPFEPLDQAKKAIAIVDLSGIEALSFHAVIGGDYPVGHDAARRKTISARSVGAEARFITVLEPYEGEASIVTAEAMSDHELKVQLSDGRTQVVTISNFEGDGQDILVQIKEFNNEIIVREEQTASSERSAE